MISVLSSLPRGEGGHFLVIERDHELLRDNLPDLLSRRDESGKHNARRGVSERAQLAITDKDLIDNVVQR